MKIGIITFHYAWNCGAVLQCYALKSYLQNAGHDVTIINYRPNYNNEKYKKYPNLFLAVKREQKNKNRSKLSRLFFSLYSSFKLLREYLPNSTRKKKKKYFDDFFKDYFKMTEEYKSITELQDNPPNLDVYISGSDQVWNTKLTNNKIDEAYYCNFGSLKIKRIGFAISACQLDTTNNLDKLKRLINGFDFLSLREEEKRIELEKIYRKKIQICMDPTFLLKPDDYSILEEKCRDLERPYILVYAFDFKENRMLLFDTVKRVSELTGKSVKVIYGPMRWPYKVEILHPRNCISPGMFLTYIKKADIIITNSFHATTFSLIYKKDFYSLIAPGRGSRVIELLSNLGLKNRIISQSNEIPNFIDNGIIYDDVDKKINEMRKYTTRFLSEAIFND